MAGSEEEYPKPVESMPNESLSFSFLHQLREEDDQIMKISVRRYPSIEAIDRDDPDILELSIGLIPTEVEEFIIDRFDELLMFEFDEDCWWVTAKIQRGGDAEPFLSQIIKPYVALRQVAEHMYINQ